MKERHFCVYRRLKDYVGWRSACEHDLGRIDVHVVDLPSGSEPGPAVHLVFVVPPPRWEPCVRRQGLTHQLFDLRRSRDAPPTRRPAGRRRKQPTVCIEVIYALA